MISTKQDKQTHIKDCKGDNGLEHFKPLTKERFEEMKRKLEKAGFTTKTKWRKGLKTISLAPIVLGEYFSNE